MALIMGPSTTNLALLPTTEILKSVVPIRWLRVFSFVLSAGRNLSVCCDVIATLLTWGKTVRFFHIDFEVSHFNHTKEHTMNLKEL